MSGKKYGERKGIERGKIGRDRTWRETINDKRKRRKRKDGEEKDKGKKGKRRKRFYRNRNGDVYVREEVGSWEGVVGKGGRVSCGQ